MRPGEREAIEHAVLHLRAHAVRGDKKAVAEPERHRCAHLYLQNSLGARVFAPARHHASRCQTFEYRHQQRHEGAATHRLGPRRFLLPGQGV